MIDLPEGCLRLPEAARLAGRSYAWLAEQAWAERVPFRLMRTTPAQSVSAEDMVFTEEDVMVVQRDAALVALAYSRRDRGRADAVARRLVRAGMTVAGA